ncbi:MAG: nucleoside-diphosphate kinase [Candidatus Lindowbacteria bacterium RIFCSPLOWO2_12_FULL_62_27]|nr:MAG: nucleoside-diphosphate kinase [Candidatus Lindowbacteria bacterium RIFCSPLOWO2_12_FULL_62_27]
MERTFSMVKPDGVDRGLIGEVLRRYESNGLKISALRMTRLVPGRTQEFYGMHRGKPFFDELVAFVSSGPVVGMVVEGEDAIRRVRDIMGATNYKQAIPGTIRAEFAREITRNIVHGSDSPESAAREIEFFFGGT